MKKIGDKTTVVDSFGNTKVKVRATNRKSELILIEEHNKRCF